ncbi:hypothetical protein DRF59_12615 [Chryseobacterium flavum]|uniref:Uncharacterized protein n=1 Tax=Chryseobacterium flavum TaxID=415851 RepID=A0A3D9CKQ5_9FLAO|nr:hypothetical protein [Chryseobacterium flavum]REC66308.1 hypothetical protein DRF59_12615 [Chryseobacterium flavum]
MKIIKRFVNLINIFFLCIIFLSICGCKKQEIKEIEKKETLGLRGPINSNQSQVLQSNKWKLRRYKITNQDSRSIIYEKDIDDKIVSFNEKTILINNKNSGKINYNANEFVIDNIDTLTNKFYLIHLRNGQLILKNDVYYYKEKKKIKHLKIELNLSTDTIKTNTDYYKIEY